MAKKDTQKTKKPSRTLKMKNGEPPSTQKHMPFAEIRDGVVILKNGELRRVVLVSSLNFALKSEDEQKGIVQGYVQFLNTLDFELQIVMQSRTLNIEQYLDKLDTLARTQENELLKRQTISYRSFVGKLVEDAQIMDKKFFVVVPFAPDKKKKRTFWTRFKQVLSAADTIKIKDSQFDEYLLELNRRASSVIGGLKSIGLFTQVLDTQALIELYYNSYNPVTKQKQRVEDISQMQIDWDEQ